MSIEDIKSRAITIGVGEGVEIKHPNGAKEVISFFPQDMPEKAYNYNGASICFVSEHRMYVLPYHRETYEDVLREAGFTRNLNLYVPFSDGVSYPKRDKNKWISMMQKSRA